MSQMKAWRIHRFGGPESVQCDDVAIPEPGAQDVLVRVRAASLNPVDLKTADGRYPMIHENALPYTLGRDFAGVVESTGSAVADWRPGDEVMGFVGQQQGAFADYVCVERRTLARRPASIDATLAGAVPLAALTAWQGLFDHGGLQAGQRVLIHAASGGVGHFAIQFAKARGAYVFATASGDGVAFARELGADEVIDYRTQRFEDVARDVDLVYDLVDGDTQQRSWAVLKRGGALISTLTQPSSEDAGKYGVRAGRYTAQPDGAELAQVGELIDARKVTVKVAETFASDRLPDAFAHLARGHVRGKLVLAHA